MKTVGEPAPGQFTIILCPGCSSPNFIPVNGTPVQLYVRVGCAILIKFIPTVQHHVFYDAFQPVTDVSQTSPQASGKIRRREKRWKNGGVHSPSIPF